MASTSPDERRGAQPGRLSGRPAALPLLAEICLNFTIVVPAGYKLAACLGCADRGTTSDVVIVKKKLVQYLRKVEWQGDAGPVDRLLLAMYARYRRFRRRLRRIDNPTFSRLFLRSRYLKRNLSGRRFNFVTIDQATIWTNQWVRTFPQQYDLIVGVPRSGMLIATIIALKLGKGLTTPDLLKLGKYWHSSQAGDGFSLDDVKHILLVDDSIDKGRAMRTALDQIRSTGRTFEITRGALIVREDTKHLADLYFRVIEPPRTFEWNILHRKIASYSAQGILAVDLDGVLCANPPAGADNDEAWYLEWIRAANPYLIPRFEIDHIVTCRLEKYRQETERWLERQGVRYGKLHMWDVPNKGLRGENFADHKIDMLLKLKPDLFWESDLKQAERIWQATRIPTLCVDEMTLLN